MPFAARLLPRAHAPDIRGKGAPMLVGALVMALHVLAGVSGAVLDMFFLGRDLDRRLVVATKAMTQSLGHAIKFVYFTFVAVTPLPMEPATISRALEVPVWVYAMAAGLAICGTTLARPVLHRFSNEAFQLWSRRLVLGIGTIYLVQGGVALAQ
jgi:hypothetical protein